MEINQELLERHVIESNAIENIFAGEGHHLFADHLEAAKLVVISAQELRVIAQPEEIHRILMRRELPDAGQFRMVRVWVGLDAKARPEDTKELMERWRTALQSDLKKGLDLSSHQKEELAWHYHHWFEAIHPFIDGNGRTGRLVLNNIRLLLGLPWLIVNFSERQQYYDKIKKWETEHKALLEKEGKYRYP